MSRLERERVPSGFDQLTRGEVPDDIKAKVAAGQIVV